MDFMGLSSKDSFVAVKQEIVEEDRKIPGIGMSSEVPWPLSNKVSALSHFTYEQDDKLSMVSNVPAQLTIFYAGTVSVFDDISPEKAQAIMILAGNGVILSNMAHEKLEIKAPVSRLLVPDREINQSMNVQPCPISVSSHPIERVPNTLGALFNNAEEPPRIVSSLGSAAATAMLSSAVPQARKASLARFLEKRKERVMSAAPYNISKMAADSGTTSGAGSSCVSNCDV